MNTPKITRKYSNQPSTPAEALIAARAVLEDYAQVRVVGRPNLARWWLKEFGYHAETNTSNTGSTTIGEVQIEK